jgi:hypothetical protein
MFCGFRDAARDEVNGGAVNDLNGRSMLRGKLRSRRRGYESLSTHTH